MGPGRKSAVWVMRSLKVCGWVCASRCHWPGLLDLEDRQRLASADEAHRRLIRRVEDEVIHIGACPSGLLDQGQAFLDGAEGAQPQQVKLDQTQPLDIVFVDLQRAHAIGGDAHRQDGGERLAGEHHAAVVQARGGAASPPAVARSPADVPSGAGSGHGLLARLVSPLARSR